MPATLSTYPSSGPVASGDWRRRELLYEVEARSPLESERRRRMQPRPRHSPPISIGRADSRCLQGVASAACGWLGERASREHSQDMFVGEDQRVAVNAADFRDYAVGSAADIGRLLSAGPTVSPERPTRMDFFDLPGG